MSKIEQQLKVLRSVMEEWPVGALVWHRADGRRGVIVEYAMDGAGCVMVVVSWGADRNWDKCLALELSGAPVSDGTAGDEWKDGGNQEAGR